MLRSLLWMRRSRACERRWRRSRSCGRGSPGLNVPCPVTAAIPRCRPRGMMPRAASRRGLIADVTGAQVSAGFIGAGHIPASAADPLILEFRRAVRAGLASVPRIPGPKHSTAQHPGRDPGWISAATSTPPANTARTYSPPCVTSSPETRGVRPNPPPCRHNPNRRTEPSISLWTHGVNVYDQR
jgi:hypothetical protein